MYDAIVSMCERAIYQYDFNNVVPKPEGNGHPLLAPFGIYNAKDGFVAIGIVENSYWDVLKKIIDFDDLLNDKKYGTISLRAKNRKALAVRAGFKIFIPVPPKTSLPITTAKTTETASIHNGTSTGIIRGISIPETRYPSLT